MRPLTHLAAIKKESTTVVEIQARIVRMVVIIESTTISVDHSQRIDVEVKNGTLISANAESFHARGLESPKSPPTVRRVLRQRRRRKRGVQLWRRMRTRPKWHPIERRAARPQRNQSRFTRHTITTTRRRGTIASSKV
ncbi:MAG: hypothetical protein EBZ36_14860 [Acidobacteria bacterium]|nr:hypothetical protein [Acidobacteriota bacterium]